ncbi:MAG: PIG-L family deacetylase [Clostridia bacterium]|nr:PIG-L family deacetylase [Clostridia bacterium]
MKKIRNICLLALALLLACLPLGATWAEEDPSLYSIETGPLAVNLSGRCTMTSDLKSTAYSWRLTDGDLGSVQKLEAGQRVSLTWNDQVPVKAAFLAFKDYPEGYRIQQFDAAGTLLKEEAGPRYISHAVYLEEGARTVTVVPESEIVLCSFYAYGEGIVPDAHPWTPVPEKLDYLIVAMHPDDDVLFMGAIVPLYTVEQGRTGTIFYTATRERVRKDEAGNGAWIMGLRNAPILGTFPDIPPSYMEQYKHTFQQADVVKYLVALFRQYKPEVVFSHDLNGEYGHWQHVILAHAVQEAVPLAADPGYDQPSAEQYGTWQIKKLYLHLYPENPIQLPAAKPLDAYGGLTSVDVAAAAFQCHKSQLPSRHAVSNEGVYSMSDFGLAYTAVGLDTPGVNDPFEHVDPAVLHAHATPTPEPTPAPTDTPTPTDTPVPTDTPTPVPTDTPAPTDTPSPTDTPVPAETPQPTPSPTDTPMDDDEDAPEILFWLLPALVGLAALLCFGISFLTKRWWQRLLLWALALLLAAGAALLLVRNHPRMAQRLPFAPTPTPTATPAVYELTFTTDTLPESSALSAYPVLRSLDLTDCEQVDAARFEAIRQAVPADCVIRWSVPLTDGRFPADSTELVLPHFSPEDGALLPYFENLAALDVSGTTAYDALLALKEARPDLALTYTLPVGDRVLTLEDETIAVTEAPDLDLLSKMLPAFPALQTLDLTEAPVDPAEAIALKEAHPELTVLYAVPLGSIRVSPDTESLALAGFGVQSVQELLSALPYLPDLKQVDLHGTGLGIDDLAAIQAARPDLALSQAVDLFGQTVETDATELDLRNAAYSAQELPALLKPFLALQRVYLRQDADVEATAALLRETRPETVFVYETKAFGRTVESTIEELDVSQTHFATAEEVKAELVHLPCLQKLVMCDCGLSNQQMEELIEAYPAVKFVWNIRVGPHKLRTDALGFSTKNPTKYTNAQYSDAYNRRIKTVQRLNPGDLEPLKYCTDLLALDVGHNYLINEDLDVLQYLPHLQVLILADNKFTDISALHQLKELRYVELFMNRIPDMSPLVGLENLTDINVANTHLEDIAPLMQLTHAKRLWFSMNNLTTEQNKAVVNALPNCVCNYTTRNETLEGWREGETYQWMRSFFNDK